MSSSGNAFFKRSCRDRGVVVLWCCIVDVKRWWQRVFVIVVFLCRWLVDNENDICDAVRGTTLGLPVDVDYTELKQKALDGEVDWVPPAFTYHAGKRVRAARRVIRMFN